MWETVGALITVLSPLVAVPLTMITFYLRSMHEHQVTAHATLTNRVERIETTVSELRRAFAEFERDYTTKEEWLREYMQARRTLEQLSETVVRLETMLDASSPRPTTASPLGAASSSHVTTSLSGLSTSSSHTTPTAPA